MYLVADFTETGHDCHFKCKCIEQLVTATWFALPAAVVIVRTGLVFHYTGTCRALQPEAAVHWHWSEFTLTRTSSDTQKYHGHSDCTFIHRNKTEATERWTERNPWGGWEGGGQKRGVGLKREEKGQQIEASRTKWEGVCWPGHKKKIK